MTLTIEIPCNTGIEMEENLNKAIADFSEALQKNSFIPMELVAYSDLDMTVPIYKLNLK